MALLAYNLTNAVVHLVISETLSVTLPVNGGSGRGPAVNVTSEVHSIHTDSEVTDALEAQRAGVVLYAWTGPEEFDCGALTISSGGNNNVSIDARIGDEEASTVSLDSRVCDLESGSVSAIESIDALSLVSADTSLTTRVGSGETSLAALSLVSKDTSLTARVSSIDALSLPSSDASLTARVSSLDLLSITSHDASLTSRLSSIDLLSMPSVDSALSSATASLKLSLDNRLSVASIGSIG